VQGRLVGRPGEAWAAHGAPPPRCPAGFDEDEAALMFHEVRRACCCCACGRLVGGRACGGGGGGGHLLVLQGVLLAALCSPKGAGDTRARKRMHVGI